MSKHDLERLAQLCLVIDHLENHAKFVESEPFIREREALLAVAVPPKPAQQAQAKKR